MDLYIRPSCPYCKLVISSIPYSLAKSIIVKDINYPRFEKELIRKGHKRQVPCLILKNGYVIYESRKIIDYLLN